QAGIASPRGAMSCAPARAQEAVTLTSAGGLIGRLRAVPFAKEAKHIALLAQDRGQTFVALVDPAQLTIGEGTNIAGEALNAVNLEGARAEVIKEAPVVVDRRALMLMGAAMRAMQMTGALETILDLAVGYANERIAFGRAIAKF